MFGRPSRSYAAVDHDAAGLSSVRSIAPSGLPTRRVEGGFKTYRPRMSLSLIDSSGELTPSALIETHGPRHLRKEPATAGQKAELDRILDPDYKSTINAETNGESSSMAASRSSHRGGRSNSGMSKHSMVGNGLGIKSTASINNFKAAMNLNGKKAAGGYTDSKGRLHDTEYDPFKGVSEASRKQSRRRSAFGSDRRGHGSESSASTEGSEVDGKASEGGGSRKSIDGGGREEEEIRKRLDSERRRLDDLTGTAMARRRSMMSERSGRGTPSVRSGISEDTRSSERLSTHRTKSQQGGIYYHTPSPLSPSFEKDTTTPDTPGSRARTNTTSDGGDPDHPRKVTESTLAPPGGHTSPPPPPPTFNRHKPPGMLLREPTKERIEIRSDGSKKITGFDAPSSPMPPSYPTLTSQPSTGSTNNALDIPISAKSRGSRGSSERERGDGESMISTARRPKPAERPREESFPETPAQAKKREERERRAGRATAGRIASISTTVSNLGVNATITKSTRPLPEIQIMEDDDPRIIFNPVGAATRVQTVHDHVIRGPFSLALQAQGQGLARIPSGGSRSGSPGPNLDFGADGYSRKATSIRSTPFSTTGSQRGSTVIEEGQGGYLPSRWANGDKRLRTTEEEKEAYRPQEWGGKHGDLGGRGEEWR